MELHCFGNELLIRFDPKTGKTWIFKDNTWQLIEAIK